MADRPNIVFLLNDHQAYYRHGWDGGAMPRRPHFDRLAAEGIRFERAYTPAPLCGPARRSLLTGLYPHNHKNYFNYSDAPYDREVYLDALAQAGYRNYYFGKWHAGPGTALDHHCEGFSYPAYGNPYITEEYREYLRRRGLPEAEFYVERCFWHEDFRKQFLDLAENIRYKCNSFWCGENAVGLLLTPPDTYEAFFLAHTACDKLSELAKSGDGRPFALRVDFWGPHPPYFPSPEFANQYDPADIAEYGSFRDTLENKPELYRRRLLHPLGDENLRPIIPSPLPLREWQKIMARAYAQITMVDAAGGLILDKLDELGLSENTLVIWTTDHGDAVFSHGGLWDKGSYMSEELMRVPLAMRLPGRIAPGIVSDELASLLDIPCTMLDAAGTRFQQGADGTSLLPLAQGQAESWRQDLMSETYGHGWGNYTDSRMIVSGHLKYIANPGDLDELYDLERDPYELANLADDPQHRPLLDGMRERLRSWQKQSGDPVSVLDKA